MGGRDSVAWLACGDWLPSGNGPKTFLKKRLARDGKAVSMYTTQPGYPEANHKKTQ